MESNLRPLTLGEILDRTAQLYRSNFLLFAGIFSVYCGVGLVLNLLVIGLDELLKIRHVSRPAIVLANLLAGGLELLVLFLLLGAAVAAVSRSVAWVNLGESATIRSAYASVLPRLGRYLWLMTITAVIVWLPAAVLYGSYVGMIMFYGKGLGIRAGVAPAPHLAANQHALTVMVVATVAFGLLLIPTGIYTTLMGLRYALALPACVVEDLKARASLRRSVELSKGSRGRIFVLGLLVGIIKIGLALLSQTFIIVAVYRHHGEVPPGLNALSQVIAFFTNTFVGPIYATGITLFYYDQRMRKEGFDIEWMMQAAGMIVPGSDAAPSAPHPAGALPESGTFHD